MTTQIALEVKKAIKILDEVLGIPPQKIGSLIHLHNEGCYLKLQEASAIWNKFDKADIEEKAVMLGMTVTKSK